MNLILSNLSDLKAAVLPEQMRARTDWDSPLAGLGKGVAASLQTHCNRLFERVADDTFEHPGACSYLSLPRFPVEGISALEIKVDEAGGWAAQPDGTILQLAKSAGIVEFGSPLGSWSDRIRVTYTGGFFANYSEDAENPDTQPAGSAEMPADLIHAWHLQVQHEIESTNLLRGVAAKRQEGKSGESTAIAAELKLLRRVVEMLRPYVRYC